MLREKNLAGIGFGIRPISIAAVVFALFGFTLYFVAQADSAAQAPPFSQNWSNAGLIANDDDWGSVPGMIGYRGDALTDATATDPQTIVADGTNTPVDVNADEANPNTFTTGGVAEFAIANAVVALQPSGTADAPFVLINLNTAGQNNIQVAYNLRDIDGSTDNAVQPVALQYRVGNAGNFTNLPAGYVADATSGPSLATLVTPVSVALPAAANNQALVQIRMITANAVGNDEWVGIDDINVTGSPISGAPSLSINNASTQEGDSGTKTLSFAVSLSAPAPAGGTTFDIATQDDTATTANNDYIAKTLTAQTIPAGSSSYNFEVTINGDGASESDERFFVNVTNPTGATLADGQGIGTIVDDDTITLIHDIQGTSETPNFNNQLKRIRGIVVGDFQGAGNLNGFFVEEEQADWDGNANTSEGIFVFAPGAPDVKVGDNVTVAGKVVNFPSPTGVTELTEVTTVIVNSGGNPLPPVQTATLPVATSPAADLEKFEGMLVRFTQTLFVNDNSTLGQFGELSLAASRLFVPTNSIDPNDNPASGNSVSGSGNVAAINAEQALNNRSRIVLDDGKTGSYPNPIPFIGAGTNSTIRIGDSVANLTGVMNFAFSSYRIVPTVAPAFTAANPRPNSPPPVGGSLKVASFNLENFFFSLGTGRGAGSAEERNRQRDKLAAAIATMNADVIGLIELEKGTQSNPNAAVNELLAKLNTLGAGTYAAVPTPAAVYDATNPVGTDTEIKSGMIYRTSSLGLVGGVLTDTAAAAGTYSRAPIAQAFQSKSNGAVFFVVVAHSRSKVCSANTPGEDGDESTGQGCFNARRRLQSQALVNFINAALSAIDPDVLLVGDLNAYGQEDPVDVLRAAGLSDVIGGFVRGGSQYSYNFQGQLGRLDHAFSTASMAAQVSGAAIWHINADEPDAFDYNRENKPDDRYAATPFRSADHDPALIGINPACPQLLFSPSSLASAMKGAPYNQTIAVGGGAPPYKLEITEGALPEGVTFTAPGVLSGSPAKSGIFNFTVTATSGGGCSLSRRYSLVVNEVTTTIASTSGCLGPGGLVDVTSTVANSGADSQRASFTATLPAKLLALPGACSSNVGSCAVVSPSKVTWSGTLSTGQKATISYQVQVSDVASAEEELCIDSTAKVGASVDGSSRACVKVTCRPIGIGTPPSTGSPAEGQKAGSVLIFNVYTSATDSARQNTRISITNIEPSRATYLHLFFVDGSTCAVADYNFCLTANQTATFLTAEFDPGTTGYVIAVAVDSTGCPTNFNYLIGEESVKFASGQSANLSAIAVSAIAGGLTSCNTDSIYATLAFDGVSYNPLPLVVAADNIPNRAEGNDSMLILNRIGGNMGLEADKLGHIQGVLYNDEETGIGFNFLPTSCQFIGIIASSSFRTVPRIEQFIPAGHSGWLKIWQADARSAMTGALINFNPNSDVIGNAFNQGHNLHTLRTTSSATIRIPVFPPNC